MTELHTTGTVAAVPGRAGFRILLALAVVITGLVVAVAPGGSTGGERVVLGAAPGARSALPQNLEVRLRVPKGAREVGTATITAAPGGAARVQVEFTQDVGVAAAAGLVRPARIVVGTCSNNTGVTKYGLSNVALGRSETTVAGATLEDLYQGKFSIVVTRSLDERNTSVACGEVVGG